MTDQPDDELDDDEPADEPSDEEGAEAPVDPVAAVLDPDAEKVVLEVAEWSPEDRADLIDALNEEGVRHALDEMGDLWIEAIDEDRVDTILDELVDEDDDEEDLPDGSTALSDLFVAADRIRKHPHDARAILDAVDAATTVIALPAPYGIERGVWAKVGLRAGALRNALETEADDEVVVEAATELRELLHPMV